ncbi:hypothetical protein PInf_011643 [Phytophthora infestans]|nr:hypothetical protein PInf_011643 [Phytophthora infestans]
MAALRYVRADCQKGNGVQSTGEGGSLTVVGGGRLTEEGDTRAVRMLGVEASNGGEQADTAVTMHEYGSDDEEIDETSTTTTDGAKERNVAKARRRRTKQERVRAVKQRAIVAATTSDDIDEALAVLDAERQSRREQQGREVRAELARRQQLHERQDGQLGTGEHIKLRLVQRQRSVTDTDATGASDDLGVSAEDGLPTATMDVEVERLPVKLDSGERYSVTGTDWMLRGERSKQASPVDVVEGIGGVLLDVLGVWTFNMRNTFGQDVTVSACIIDGCKDEFLVGIGFMQQYKAVMDFERNEMRYEDRKKRVVIPFRTDEDGGSAKVATVRLVRRTPLTRQTVTPIEVSVTAPDDEKGIFVPTTSYGTVMLATTVTRSRNGKATIFAVNVHGGKVKLPSKAELGTWIPLEENMQVLTMNGELDNKKLGAWLKELGDDETPLDNEDEVRIGSKETGARNLIIRLLRAYRKYRWITATVRQ